MLRPDPCPARSPLVAEFSQPLDPSTVTSTNFSITWGGPTVSGTRTLSDGIYGPNTIVTFVPTNPWASSSSYNVYISTGIKSASGNPLLQYYSGYFSTGTASDNQAPYVIGVNPPDGVVGVSVNTVVTVQFSEPMAPSTINRLSFKVSDSVGDILGRVVRNSSTTFSFIPDSLLGPNTEYTVTVEATVTDISGNHIASAFASTFATQSLQDRYQPSVIQVDPYNYQSGVPLNSDITIVFDERIDPLSVNSSSFYVDCSQVYPSRVSGSISVSEDGLLATFIPSQPLLPNAQHSITYANGIRDVAGNALYNPGGTYFTTGIELADATPPQVLEINPVDGATNVPTNAEILIRFSETLDRTTVNGSTLIVSAGGVPLQGNLTHSGNIVRFEVANFYTFAPNTFYEVRITTGVRDTAGNPLPQEFVSGFTTGSAQDTVAPGVVSVVPASGSINVSPDTSVEVTFTEPINPLTVNNSTVLLDYYYQQYVYGNHAISADRRKVTFTPSYPLFAGHTYYVILQNVEDLAANKLPSQGWAYPFTTAYAPGTDVNSFPTQAAVLVNPNRLFADGISTTTVEISNINRSGVLVPNGTKVAVSGTSGSILGGTNSPDPRYRVFTTIAGKVTLTYQSPNLHWLTPGSYSTAYIQVASVDAGDRPVSHISTTGSVTLYRGYNVSVDPNPVSLLANGSSFSEVNVTVYDYYSQPVPAGMRVGVTAAPVYKPDSLGGTIQGGEVAVDSRFKVFQTITGGMISFTYTSPALGPGQSGKAWIQVVEVDDAGQVVGRMGEKEINLSSSTGYTAPQPRVVSVTPTSSQSGVSLNSPVVAEFSQPLDPSTVTSNDFSITKTGGSASGSLTLSDGIYGPNTIVTFVPTNPWPPNTSHTVYIGTGLKSVSGNPLLNYVYSYFSTGVLLADTVGPSVLKVNPSDGNTSVAVNAPVSVEFSEPMNSSTLNSSTFKLKVSGIEVAGGVQRLGSTYFRFIPDDLLLPNTQYQVSIDPSAKDAAGNPLASTFTSTFTTQTGMDNYQPAVISISPSNGTIEVPPTNPTVITFSESMDPTTLNGANCYINDSSNVKVPSMITLSAGDTQVTITPVNPLFAGRSYSISLSRNVKDIAGNSLPSDIYSGFTTALGPGTGTLPNGATLTINPKNLFANGEISTTATISNINVNGTPVPNGTLIAVTAAPAFNLNSAGGIISGPSVGTSVDTRFLLFETEGASVTVFYTPPEIGWLTPGATASGIIQVASVDSDTRPVSLIVQDTATLYRLKTAGITANPATLPADGSSQSNVEVTVRDNSNNLVPDGTEVGITVAPVFVANSAGGTILGGTQSGADGRVRIFTTTNGRFSFVYQSPSSRGPGYAIIQAVTVNNQGAPTGLINTVTINLN